MADFCTLNSQKRTSYAQNFLCGGVVFGCQLSKFKPRLRRQNLPIGLYTNHQLTTAVRKGGFLLVTKWKHLRLNKQQSYLTSAITPSMHISRTGDFSKWKAPEFGGFTNQTLIKNGKSKIIRSVYVVGSAIRRKQNADQKK